MAQSQPILVVGSVALDDIETPVGRRPECLGGSATYFSTGASTFTDVRLVAVVSTDFPEVHLDGLRARGVDLSGLERVEGETFRWRGRYGEGFGDAETLATHLNVFEHFSPKIPEAHRKTPVVFLGNIHPALQLDVLDQLEDPMLVAADTMNFWITGEREALERVMARIDLLIINETEARQLSGERNLHKAAAYVLAKGPSTLVIKLGAYGAMLFHKDGVFASPAVPLTEVVDPTGAGDTFASGMVGYIAKQGDTSFATMKHAVLHGTVMASFTVQGFSLDRLMTLTDEERLARLQQLRDLMDPD